MAYKKTRVISLLLYLILVTSVEPKSTNRSIKQHSEKDIDSRQSFSESTAVPVNPFVFSAEELDTLRNAGGLQEALSIAAYEPKKIDPKKAEKSNPLEDLTRKQPANNKERQELVKKRYTEEAANRESKLDRPISKKETNVYNTGHFSKRSRHVEAPPSNFPRSTTPAEPEKFADKFSTSQNVQTDQKVSANSNVELNAPTVSKKRRKASAVRSEPTRNKESNVQRFTESLSITDRLPRPFSLSSDVSSHSTQATHLPTVASAEPNYANLQAQLAISPRQSDRAYDPNYQKVAPKQQYARKSSITPTEPSNLHYSNVIRQEESTLPLRVQPSAATYVAPTYSSDQLRKAAKLGGENASIRQYDEYEEAAIPPVASIEPKQLAYVKQSKKSKRVERYDEATPKTQSKPLHHYKVVEETAEYPEELSQNARKSQKTLVDEERQHRNNADYNDQAQGQNEQVTEVRYPPEKAAEDLAVEADQHHKEHHKPEAKHSEAEEAGSEEHHKGHHEESGEKGEKGYEEFHEHDEGEKGHHDKEHHDHRYDEKKGKDKKHHDEAGFHHEHEKGEEGEKKSEFSEKGKHNKGHSTKGEHVIHKKDEFEKKTEFFDEFHEGGDFEKEGAHQHEHHHKKGGHHKKGHHHEGHDEEHRGKKGHHEKGHHHREKKGHDEHEGHDHHHEHEARHGKKGGHESAKKWMHKKGHE